MKNLNDYNQEKFFSEYATKELTKLISQDFDVLTWDKQVKNKNFDETPREQLGASKFSMVPFYYFQPLLEKNPEVIYDLGCGWNIFKKYISNIIGVGPETPGSKFYHADIFDFVDDDYMKAHENYFDSVFSINALHFYPIEKIRKRILDFSSMVKKNGRAFLALNVARMVENSEQDFKLDLQSLENFVRQELANMPFTYLIFDVDFTVYDEFLDGNIRVVFEK
jgi:hypothetical protein